MHCPDVLFYSAWGVGIALTVKIIDFLWSEGGESSGDSVLSLWERGFNVHLNGMDILMGHWQPLLSECQIVETEELNTESGKMKVIEWNRVRYKCESGK